MLIVVIVLCMTLTLLSPTATAVGTVYFCGVNDKLLPLNDQMIPLNTGSEIYLPYKIFTAPDTKIGVFCAVSSDQSSLLLYNTEKRLIFDIAGGTITDQNDSTYYYSVRVANGTVYLPASLVCSFFGLTMAVVLGDPAPIIRLKNASAVYNDKTFRGIYESDMQSAYNQYIGLPANGQPATAHPSTSPSAGHASTHENDTVYLSFTDLAAGQLDLLLDILDTSEYKCGFFIAADEIADNADLLRRAAGAGNMLGIWLSDGTYQEYRAASELLFEATKIRTLFVSAGGETRVQAEEMAGEKGLIFCSTDSTYDETAELTLPGITEGLGSPGCDGQSLSFACSETITTILPALLTYLMNNKYDVRRITETNRPPIPAE